MESFSVFPYFIYCCKRRIRRVVLAATFPTSEEREMGSLQKQANDKVYFEASANSI